MALHIGKVIRQRLEETGMTKSEFARRISTSPQNIYGIFRRKSIDVELLGDVSRCLDYDFFQHYSSKVHPVVYKNEGKGEVLTAAELKQKLDECKDQIKIARSENEYLKQIIKLMKEKETKK